VAAIAGRVTGADSGDAGLLHLALHRDGRWTSAEVV
jgi:hypothetical protein